MIEIGSTKLELWLIKTSLPPPSQAVWALGNIAGDSAEYRDITLSFGIMEPLLLLLQDPTLKVAVMRNATWTLSNLCRGKSPPPDLGAVSGLSVHTIIPGYGSNGPKSGYGPNFQI